MGKGEINPYRTDSMSVDEYFQIRENSEELLEYIKLNHYIVFNFSDFGAANLIYWGKEEGVSELFW